MLILGPLIVLVATVVVMTLALQLSFKIVTGSTIEFRDALIINIVAGMAIFAAGFIASGMELTEGVRSAVESGLNFVIFTVLIAWMSGVDVVRSLAIAAIMAVAGFVVAMIVAGIMIAALGAA